MLSQAKRSEKTPLLPLDQITSYLNIVGSALVAEISAHTGMRKSAVRKHLLRLREAGDVRKAPHHRSDGTVSPYSAWTLGAEVESGLEDRPRRHFTPATQLGSFFRDPLVAALFGDRGGQQNKVRS